MIFLKLILFIFILLTIFDIFLRLRPKSKLKIIPKSNSYKFNKLKDVGEYKCEFQIFNNSSNKETMIPNFIIKPLFLIENNLVKLKSQNSIFIDDGVSRKNINNYWQTIIIKSKSSIKVFITISLKNALNRKVNYLWLRLNWENYGHFGLKQRENYFY